jgi:exosortase
MEKNKIILFIKFGIVSMLALFLYFPELRSMVIDWSDKKEYSHGFLIPLVSGYVIWTKRDMLRNMPVMPDIKGLFILLAGIFLLVAGSVAFEPFTRRFSLIITILGLVYLLLGSGIYKVLLFPIGYLFFMIPLPYIILKSIAVSLRLVGAKVTYNVLSFFGMPIIQDGVNLELPNISLVVGDLCTGVLSLVSITALSVIYAYFTQKSLTAKVSLVVLSIPIAIFSNFARLVMTVGLAYFYGESILGNVIHQFHGTVNFLITVVLLAITGNVIRKIDMRIHSRSLK